MTVCVSPVLDSARMQFAQAEQAIQDAIDNPGNSSWLRAALIALQRRDAPAALADVIALYRLTSERAQAEAGLMAVMESMR